MRKIAFVLALFLVFALLPLVIAEDSSTNSSVAVCSDSDGGKDSFVQGITKWSVSDGSINSQQDYCIDSTNLFEGYCDSSDTNKPYRGVGISCDYGCSEGVCLKSKPVEATCKDSDDGLNYFIQGQTTVQNPDSSSTSTGFDDVCLNSITLSEGYCDNNQLLTQKIDCKFGCSRGVCIKQEEAIKEQVTCIFKGSTSDQQCYAGEIQMGCKGIDTCTADISLEKGKKITWKSSCGGYQYTIQDGSDETITFDCSPGETNESKVEANAFRKAYWQCYDGKESFQGGESSCKPYGLWKKYASDFCEAKCSSGKEKCGVSSFSLSTPCYSDLPQKEVPSSSTTQVPVVGGASSADCENYAQECKIGNQQACDKWQANCQNEKTEIPILNICKDSCSSDDKCYPFGYRKAETFCSDSGAFVKQLEADNKCDNNFECGSNVCVNNKCISPGLIDKMLNWFKKLFGGK